MLDGVAGKAYTWRRLHWCPPTGPVPNSDPWEALLLAIDMAQHINRWEWSPWHQGIPGNERADALAEKGRQDHPLLRYPSPDKQDISHTPSPAAPIHGRAQTLLDSDSDLEATAAMTLFNTPSQASSDDQETDDFPTPHSVVGSMLGEPLPFVTPSPQAVQSWSTLQCSKQNTEQCGYDHAPVTRGRMRAQFPLPHGPRRFGGRWDSNQCLTHAFPPRTKRHRRQHPRQCT